MGGNRSVILILMLKLKATVFRFSTQFYTGKNKIFFLSKTKVVILKQGILTLEIQQNLSNLNNDLEGPFHNNGS